MNRFLSRAFFPCLLVLLAVVPPARAAESYDACTDFITSVPMTISTPGTWCLTGNLATNAPNYVIEVNVDDATIDCNGFKLDGTSRTQTVFAVGIRAGDRSNVTVRNCHLRGFSAGVILASNLNIDQPGHHVVEDNLVERCTEQGILVVGDDSVVRRNRVLETNNVAQVGAYAISAYGIVDIVDNVRP